MSYTEKPGNDINALQQLWMLTKKMDNQLVIHLPFLSNWCLENPDEYFFKGITRDFFLLELDLKQKRVTNKPKAIGFRSVDISSWDFWKKQELIKSQTAYFEYPLEGENLQKFYKGIEDSFINPFNESEDTNYLKKVIKHKKLTSYIFDLLQNFKVKNNILEPFEISNKSLYDSGLFEQVYTDKEIQNVLFNSILNSGQGEKFSAENLQEILETCYLLKYLLTNYYFSNNDVLQEDGTAISSLQEISYQEFIGSIDDEILTEEIPQLQEYINDMNLKYNSELDLKSIINFLNFTVESVLINKKFKEQSTFNTENLSYFVINNRFYSNKDFQTDVESGLNLYGSSTLEPILGYYVVFYVPPANNYIQDIYMPNQYMYDLSNHILRKKETDAPFYLIHFDQFKNFSSGKNISLNEILEELTTLQADILDNENLPSEWNETILTELNPVIFDFHQLKSDDPLEKDIEKIQYLYFDNKYYPAIAIKSIIGYKKNTGAGNIKKIKLQNLTSLTYPKLEEIDTKTNLVQNKDSLYVDVPNYLRIDVPKILNMYPILEEDFYFDEYLKEIFEPLKNRTYDAENKITSSELKDTIDKTFRNYGRVNLFGKSLITDLKKLRAEGFLSNEYFNDPENSLFNFYLNFSNEKSVSTKDLEPLFLTEMANENFIFEYIYDFLERKRNTFEENDLKIVDTLLTNYKIAKSFNAQDLKIFEELAEVNLSELTSEKVDETLKKAVKRIRINYKRISDTINKQIIPGSTEKTKGLKIPMYIGLVPSESELKKETKEKEINPNNTMTIKQASETVHNNAKQFQPDIKSEIKKGNLVWVNKKTVEPNNFQQDDKDFPMFFKMKNGDKKTGLFIKQTSENFVIENENGKEETVSTKDIDKILYNQIYKAQKDIQVVDKIPEITQSSIENSDWWKDINVIKEAVLTEMETKEIMTQFLKDSELFIKQNTPTEKELGDKKWWESKVNNVFAQINNGGAIVEQKFKDYTKEIPGKIDNMVKVGKSITSSKDPKEMANIIANEFTNSDWWKGVTKSIDKYIAYTEAEKKKAIDDYINAIKTTETNKNTPQSKRIEELELFKMIKTKLKDNKNSFKILEDKKKKILNDYNKRIEDTSKYITKEQNKLEDPTKWKIMLVKFGPK